MGLFDSLHISASALTSERLRMDVVAENLANANTVGYNRKQVVLQEVPLRFGDALSQAMAEQPGGVTVAGVVNDPNGSRRVFNPGAPGADADGFVTMPNVNTVTEMVDLITASRAYEANISALTTSRQMFQRTFDILR